jgi:enamine deaminase RidA (YjgF/YER057c/UK114 family)
VQVVRLNRRHDVAVTNYADPDSVGAPFHLYSQVSVAGELVSDAGQVGVDRDNQVVGPDVTSQALQTYENIRLILESQGAKLGDVVRFAVYLVDADDVAGFYAWRGSRGSSRAWIGTPAPPALSGPRRPCRRSRWRSQRGSRKEAPSL